jgi:tetratricopeptide (TPR) repeat protein
MKKLFKYSISSDALFATIFLATWVALVFNPPFQYHKFYAIALGSGLVLALFKKIENVHYEKIGGWFLVFLMETFLSCFWSLNIGKSFQAFGFLCLGLFIYLISGSISSKIQNNVISISMAVTSFVAMIAIWQHFFIFPELQQELPTFNSYVKSIVQNALVSRRSFGPLVTSGALGALLILFLPIFIQRTLDKEQSNGMRMVYGMGLIVVGLALIYTKSIGAWISLFISAILIVPPFFKKIYRYGFIIFGSLLILTILINRGIHRWFLLAFKGRIILWTEAWRIFLNRPINGFGVGTFGAAYQALHFPLTSGARFAHNLLFQVLVEQGLLGFILIMCLTISFWGRIQWNQTSRQRAITIGVFAFLIFSLIDIPFQMPELVWIFCFLAALIPVTTKSTWSCPIRLPNKIFEIIMLLAFAVSAFWPPFLNWNIGMLGVVVWGTLAFLGGQFKNIKSWIFLGFAYLLGRSFLTSSARGMVFSIELAGLVIALFLIISKLKDGKNFMFWFSTLGLVWAIKIWFPNSFNFYPNYTIFPNPKHLAIFLIPVVLWIFLKMSNRWEKWLLGFLAVLTIIRIWSVSAILGILLGWVVFFRKKLNWLWITICGIIGIVVLKMRLDDTSPTSLSRVWIWASAIKIWVSNIWFGVGPGMFNYLYQKFKFPRFSGPSRYLMTAEVTHNEFLEFLVAFGILGFLFLISLTFYWIQKNKTAVFKKSVMSAFSIAAFFDFCFHTPLISLEAVGFASRWEKKRKRSLFWANGIIVTGIAMGIFIPPVFSSHLYSQYLDYKKYNHYQKDFLILENCKQLDPWNAKYYCAMAEFSDHMFLLTKDPIWLNHANHNWHQTRRLEPERTSFWIRRALWDEQIAEMQRTKKYFKKVQIDWINAQHTQPYLAFIRYDQGLFYLFYENHVHKATLEFCKAVELEPNYAAAWINLGSIMKNQGCITSACSYYQRALKISEKWGKKCRNPINHQLVFISPKVQIALENQIQQFKKELK